MSQTEKIARYIENLHCDHWDENSAGCWKSQCIALRVLAEDIREKFKEEKHG